MTDDLLRGTAAIGAELGYNQRQTNHLCSIGAIPVWKTGGRWESTRTLLREYRQKLAAEALARTQSHNKQAEVA